MRDALITLAGALLSLIVLVSLMSPAQDRLLLSRPTTEDRGNHGLAAAYRWLAGNNISTHSLRRPFSRIEQAALPGSGNLLIVSLPALRQVLESEWVALNSWIGSGNSVLVLSAMYHLPQWNHSVELTRRQAIMDSIAKLTADEFSLQNDDIDLPETIFVLSDLRDSVRAFKPAPYTLYPTTRHPLFEGVGELQSWHTPGLYRYHGQSAETKSVYWTLDSDSSRLALRLMHGESPQQTGMWLLPVGEGWIYFSAFSDLLSNSVLKQHDNARWFSNLLAHALAEGGYVIFDDYHFGLSDLYDPKAFFVDQRLHNSLVFVGVFWLIYALGRSPRLAPVRRPVSEPASIDFVDAMAGFFARRIQSQTIAKYLAERLLERISEHTRLEGDSLWRWLDDHPYVAEQDIKRLQRASGYLPGRTKLIQLTRSIDRIHKVVT
jgi:hypothetical protein